MQTIVGYKYYLTQDVSQVFSLSGDRVPVRQIIMTLREQSDCGGKDAPNSLRTLEKAVFSNKTVITEQRYFLNMR